MGGWEQAWIERVIFRDTKLKEDGVCSQLASCSPAKNKPPCKSIAPCVHDGVVLVVGATISADRARVLEFGSLMAAHSYPLIIVHISDEQQDHPTDFYKHAKLVVRQYWREPESTLPNVITMPCGVKFDWDFNHANPALGNRQCLWSFFGRIGVTKKRTTARTAMKKEMDKLPGACSKPLKLGSRMVQMKLYQDTM